MIEEFLLLSLDDESSKLLLWDQYRKKTQEENLFLCQQKTLIFGSVRPSELSKIVSNLFYSVFSILQSQAYFMIFQKKMFLTYLDSPGL